MEHLIGRQEERAILQNAFDSNEAELIALYGRRRIGKTFLVRHFFPPQTRFCEMTGLKDGSMKDQLAIFARSFQKTFPQEVPLPPLHNWRYAFELLTAELQKVPKSKRVVVFFDELSWIATRRSGFLQQLDHFWNTEWSKLHNVKVILCGSAASWMIDKVVHATGGLHNRLTRTIILQPFTLSETKAYLEDRKIRLSLKQILELYLVLGGVPYYLKQIEKGLSAAQNINCICFRKSGALYDEFNRLYASLFQDSTNHEKIIRAIATVRQGISRDQLIQHTGIPSGTGLNTYLYELEEAGFIASFIPYQKSKKNIYYRVIDEYSYFYLQWIKNAPRGIFSTSDHHYWEKKAGTPTWKSWAGYAFESICLRHSLAITKALQIEKIPTEVAAWRYIPRRGSKEKGAQIDLLFDRGDGVISICEMKYSEGEFVINKAYAEALRNKIEIFKQRTTGRRKHIFLVMVTTCGVKRNAYCDELITNEVCLEGLFD
jgi:uncharacterized protein